MPFKKSISILLVVAVMLGVMYYLSTLEKKPSEQTSDLQARVSYVQGDAYKLTNGRKTQLLLDDVLSVGDVFETSSGALLVVEFDEGSIIRLDENSQVKLSEITPNSIKVQNSSGKVFARVHKDEKHTFIVSAKDIEVKALGTAFNVENEDELKVQVFESSVRVTKNGQEVATIPVNKEWLASLGKLSDIQDKEIKASTFLKLALESIALEKTASETEDKKDEEKKDEEKPVVTPTPTPVATPKPSNSSIKLTSKMTAYGVELVWTFDGNLDTKGGFKILKDDNSNPSYPGSDYRYVYHTKPSVHSGSYYWDVKDGKKWHFRVCQYLGNGKCGAYSNDVEVVAKVPQRKD